MVGLDINIACGMTGSEKFRFCDWNTGVSYFEIYVHMYYANLRQK